MLVKTLFSNIYSRGIPSPADVPPVRRPQAEPERPTSSSAPKRTNIYGDSME